MMGRFYRGENDDFDAKYPCVPQLYRVKNIEGGTAQTLSELRLIDRLKISEFELIANEFPQVKYAIKDFCNVDFTALAQHYGLKTDLLDLSCDIVVAAFFATHSYLPQTGYRIRYDGIGCLRVYSPIEFFNAPNNKFNQTFKLIGLQPFQRPGLQAAFALKLQEGENFSNISGKLLFKHNEMWNSKLHQIFNQDGRNILFPEEQIEDAAQLVRDSKIVSKDAVSKFCNEFIIPEKNVEEILNKHEIQISEKKIYSLSEQQKVELEKEFKDRPYGDVRLVTRTAF